MSRRYYKRLYTGTRKEMTWVWFRLKEATHSNMSEDHIHNPELLLSDIQVNDTFHKSQLLYSEVADQVSEGEFAVLSRNFVVTFK